MRWPLFAKGHQQLLDAETIQCIAAGFSQGDFPCVYLIEWMQTNVVGVTELCKATF